ncbi:post-GPI attachment to proteins factor 6 [Bombyx mori]|uniref:EGF-like domain-containing protein n=1 Tax=Bombyx mori TaxID=7091 RepID=A0A8R2CA02_BOMMO|nr:post-GPI attachment to proteins factor 6 [Bombyx mori]
MRFLYCLLLYTITVVISVDHEAEEESNRRRIIDQLTRTKTVLLDDYHLVTRHIATEVNMYRNYRTVSVLFYSMNIDLTYAQFTFQSEELHLNNIGSCSPQEVLIKLKHGSYPAVNPDGYDFPKDFIEPSLREEVHTIDILSDGRNRTYTIRYPKPGSWYALVYIKWEDPRKQKVEQEGLVADCRTILYTDLQVKEEEKIRFVDCYSGFNLDQKDMPATLKCMATDKPDPISLNITFLDIDTSADTYVTLRLQSLSLPSDDNYIIYCIYDPKINNILSVTFTPNPNAWHYIRVDQTRENVTMVANCESYQRTDLSDAENLTILDLMRDDKGRFFTFDYGLPTTDLQDATSVLNVTSSEIKSMRFKVNQFLDIGGSLSIEASLLMSLKYYMGNYKRESTKGDLLEFTEDNQFMKAVICLNVGHASVPLESGHCKYNDRVTPALFVLNSTDSESVYSKSIIPFPESGTWYLTFRLFCDSTVCPCPTSEDGTKYYVNSSGITDVGLSSNKTRQGSSECNASVVVALSSSSCVGGSCSNHGNCLLNTFGGMVMSFCSCSAGYGGWDCSDDSRMDSRAYMLLSILLLTLSNLVFFFSIYVATIRFYYTEAMMYAFTMLFSTFYHACDAPSQVAYCIIRGNILQFGDFYCGLMSFWVTLLAMSIVSDELRSFCQLTGAIVVALFTTWNMHSFVSFLLPVAIGATVLLVSWYLDYRKTGIMRYPWSYYSKYMPIGIILVSTGLICYAFLQTEQNYKIVHSIWHMIIAFSVVFLLPDVKRGPNANPFLPTPSYYTGKFSRYFRRSRTPIAE